MGVGMDTLGTPFRGGPVGVSSPHNLHSQWTSTKNGEIAEAALNLPKKDKEQLLALLSLVTAEQVDDPLVALWSTAVLDRVAEAIHITLPPLLLRKTLASRAAWAPIADLLRRAGIVDRQLALSFFHLLARLLVLHAHGITARTGAPLSSRLLGTLAPSVPGLLEAAYPGYMASGLLHVVLGQRQQKP